MLAGQSKIWSLIVVVAFSVLSQTAVWAQVRVSGYYRKNGTYIKPHYRSKPDGIFRNNWSTKGNFNPYTGKSGTKLTASPTYGNDVEVKSYRRADGTKVDLHYRSAPDDSVTNNWSTKGNVNPYTGKGGSKTKPSRSDVRTDGTQNELRKKTAQDNTITNNWSTKRKVSSPAGKLDFNSRVMERQPSSVSNGPVAQGHNLNFYDQARLRKSNELQNLGVVVSWRKHTFTQLTDMTNRIGWANSLQKLGVTVGWRNYSLEQLIDMRCRVEQANTLEELGVSLNWN